MATAFQLTPAQARKMGISTDEKRSSKPRAQLSPEEKQIKARIKQAEKFVQQITPLCERYGWQVGLCRAFSNDPQNVDYANIKDYEATPNCVIAWRDCAGYANPRIMDIAWLWEIDTMNLHDVEALLASATMINAQE